jgi:hypothetical protein
MNKGSGFYIFTWILYFFILFNNLVYFPEQMSDPFSHSHKICKAFLISFFEQDQSFFSQ